MMSTNELVIQRVAWLLNFGSIMLLMGCSFDLSTPRGRWVNCDVEVWQCAKTSTPPTFTLSGENPNIGNYIQRHNFWQVKDAAYQAYWDTGIFVFDSGPDVLPGSTMIMTDSTDWSDPSPAFMSVTLGEDVAGVYVAYDSRAEPKPSWLTDPINYEPLSKPLTISMMDYSTTPPGFVGLTVYKVRNFDKSGETLTLPGNDYGDPGWQEVAQGNPAMYLVFVKPLLTTPSNCGSGTGTYKTTEHWDDCYDIERRENIEEEESKVLMAARSAAADKCREDHPDDVCLTPACSFGVWTAECPDKDNSVTGCISCLLTSDGFQHNSEAVFLPANSSASGTIAGSSFTSPITGTLLFEYRGHSLAAMEVMRLNRMTLDLAPFNTEIGQFTEVKVSLVSRTDAICQDSPAPTVTPCAWYQIPANHFLCAESYRVDGELSAISSENEQVVDITVDTVTHAFTFMGSLQSTVTVDGDPVEIDITLNLAGQIVNYAPSAVAEFEGDETAECSDRANASPIHLHAGQSFDIDDGTLPDSSFEWFEDWGLVTQTSWGTGATLTIGAGQLGFGLHRFMLIVRDSQGTLATDTIDVPVADSTPPMLNVPEDVDVFTATPLPVLVSIGEATASDECLPSTGATITNDAPADSRFDAGETLVTWSADDGRGNVATGIQRIVVHSVSGLGPLLDAIRQGIAQLQAGVGQSQAGISACDPAAACQVDVGSLVVLIDETIESTRAAAELDDRGTDAYVALLESLEAARLTILEATSLLEESSPDDPDAASMLRGQAVAQLEEAAVMLDDAAQQAETIEEQVEPTDGDDGGGDTPDDDTGDEPDGGEDDTQTGGVCGFAAPMSVACIPLLVAWRLCRRRSWA
jgi:hypothetical protein